MSFECFNYQFHMMLINFSQIIMTTTDMALNGSKYWTSRTIDITINHKESILGLIAKFFKVCSNKLHQKNLFKLDIRELQEKVPK